MDGCDSIVYSCKGVVDNRTAGAGVTIGAWEETTLTAARTTKTSAPPQMSAITPARADAMNRLLVAAGAMTYATISMTVAPTPANFAESSVKVEDPVVV